MNKKKNYPETQYKTIKEIYLHAMENYSDRFFILDKDKPKDEKFKKYTFKQFGNDVEAIRNCTNPKIQA